MNNVLINWKFIRKGVPKGRKSAIDRIPESTEIKNYCMLLILDKILLCMLCFLQGFVVVHGKI